LDIVLFASSIESFGIVATNHKYQASFRIESGEITSTEEKRASVNEHLFLINIFHHPVAAYIVLMAATNTEDSALISDNSPTKLRDVEIILQVDFVRHHFVNIEEMNVFGSPLKVMNKLT
jgi:hypothetical protein